jgi:hypothetical protein
MGVIGELLFFSGFRRASLSDVLRHNLQQVVADAVERLPASDFGAKADAELAAAVAASCKVEPLQLQLEKAEGGAEPTQLTVQDRFFGGSATVQGLEITKSIPFAGDAELFELQPNQFDMNPPRGEVRGDRLVIGMTVRQQAAEEAIRYIEDTVRDVEKYIGWQADVIADHNAQLTGAALAAVQRRRATLSTASDIAKRLSGGQ